MSESKVTLIKERLKEVKYPGYSRDIVSFGFIKKVAECDGLVKIELQATGLNDSVKATIIQDIQNLLQKESGIKEVAVSFVDPAPAPTQPPLKKTNPNDPWQDQIPVEGVENIIAVASGKGGVGKSTVSVNLACALKSLGYRVGLMDCDIYGPSIPIMVGTHEKPQVIGEDRLVPIQKYGLNIMSIGFMIDEDEPVIWRGPMIQSAIKQFLHGVNWGPLDYLIVDLPPGTGDAQLSLAQQVPITGSVIVSTPQDVALIDAKKGVAMFKKINVPVLGIVENMSGFICPHCGERTDIFSTGGGKKEAEKQNVDFLGDVPLDLAIRQQGDSGIPIVVAQPDSSQSNAFLSIAKKVAEIIKNKK